MAYERGDFGIEYSTSPGRRRKDSGFGPAAAVAVVAVVAAVSFSAVRGCRDRTGPRTRQTASSPEKPSGGNSGETGGPRKDFFGVDVSDRNRSSGGQETPSAPEAAPLMPEEPAAAFAASGASGDLARLEASGSARTRVLVRRLLKLNESRDLVAAIATVEELRALPDARAAADDFLARQLGEMNMELLLSGRENKWTAEIVLRGGHTLARLAHEHGTTVSAIAKLNGIKDPGRVRAGAKLRILEHPAFSLSADTAAGTADLTLNGRFFKRYRFDGGKAGTSAEVSRQETAARVFARLGLEFPGEELEELKMLLAPGSAVEVR